MVLSGTYHLAGGTIITVACVCLDAMATMVKAVVEEETNRMIEQIQEEQSCNKQEAAKFLLHYGGSHYQTVHGDTDA